MLIEGVDRGCKSWMREQGCVDRGDIPLYAVNGSWTDTPTVPNNVTQTWHSW